MPAFAGRIVDRVQDQSDFSGSLEAGRFLRYDDATGTFKLGSFTTHGNVGPELQIDHQYVNGDFPTPSATLPDYSALVLNHTHLGTTANILSPFDLIWTGFRGSVQYGDATHLARGTEQSLTLTLDVQGSASGNNELAQLMGWFRAKPASGTPADGVASMWYTDWSLHGNIGAQSALLNGITMLVNSYDTASPSRGKSAAEWLVTKPGQGGGREDGHDVAATYPLDFMLGILGWSGTSDELTKRRGANVGIGVGEWGSGWGQVQDDEESWFGHGISIRGGELSALLIRDPHPDSGGGFSGSALLFDAQQIVSPARTWAWWLDAGSAAAPTVGAIRLHGTNGTTAGRIQWGATSAPALYRGANSQLNVVGSLFLGAGAASASAQLQGDTTTQGWLPPRWTTTQQGAIGTPATGLYGYNTITNRPEYYDGAAWQPYGVSPAIGGALTSGTPGSVLFVGAGPVFAQDNSNFFWDDANNRLGLGTAAPGSPLDVILADAATAAASRLSTWGHNSSGTPAAGFGSEWRWQLKSSTTADTDAASLITSWATATHGSRKARLALGVYDTAYREGLRIDTSGSLARVTLGDGATSGTARFYVRDDSNIELATFENRVGLASVFFKLGDNQTGAAVRIYPGINASGGATLIGCGGLILRGHYWTGSASATLDGQWAMRMLTTAPTAALVATVNNFDGVFIDQAGKVTVGTANLTTGLFNVMLSDTATATVSVGQCWSHRSTGTPAAGFGMETRWQLHSSTTQDQDAARVQVLWATATDASRKADYVVSVYDTAVREALRLSTNGTVAYAFLTGDPPASASLSKLGLGSAIASGSSSGTGLGMNFVTGFAGDYFRFQTNGAKQVRMTAGGLLSWPAFQAGDINGLDWFRAGSWQSRLRVDDSGFLNFFNMTSGSEVLVWNVNFNGDQIITGNLMLRGRTLNAALLLGQVGDAAAFTINGQRYPGASKVDSLVFATYQGNGATQPARLTITTSAASPGIADIRIDNGRLLCNGEGLFKLTDAVTAAVTVIETLNHISSGTPAAGFGGEQRMTLSSSTTADRDAAGLSWEWVVATDASRTARGKWNVYDTAVREALRVEASGSAAMVGFLGAAAIARPASYTLAGAATRTFPADPSAAYTGAADGEAKLADLNTLRTTVSSLLGVVRQLTVDLASTSGFGLLAAA